MALIRRVVDRNRAPVGWSHRCPGCTAAGDSFWHVINVEQPNERGARWSMTGDETCPTFTPSVNCSWGDGESIRRCHYFVEAGQIRYLSDSTHPLAGQTVPLPELVGPEEEN